MEITEGKEKKLTSKFIECLQGMKINERKWQRYKSVQKIKDGGKIVFVKCDCFVRRADGLSNGILFEVKPLKYFIKGDPDF